ncbi:MAG: hypothetical protein OXC44_03900 [Proteobacteria bacterium]|nr:hypothetical protein [Pseudomonadota bacterium]
MTTPLVQQVFLTGLSGVGKTRLAKSLALKLGLGLIDLDQWIVDRSGARDIKDLFEQQGENSFRSLEHQALKEVIGAHNHVIALGAGSLMDENNQKIIFSSQALTIWLKIPPSALAHAITLQKDHLPAFLQNRPLLSSLSSLLPTSSQPSITPLREKLTAFLSSQLKAREQGYSRCNVAIDTHHASFDICLVKLVYECQKAWQQHNYTTIATQQ